MGKVVKHTCTYLSCSHPTLQLVERGLLATEHPGAVSPHLKGCALFDLGLAHAQWQTASVADLRSTNSRKATTLTTASVHLPLGYIC